MALKITDSIGKIQSGLYSALIKEIYPDMVKKVPNVKTAIKNEIRLALLESPEIASLSGGSLKADFGLTTDPTSQLIDAIVETTRVEYKSSQVKGKIVGSFSVTVQPASYGNLYALSVSTQAIKGGSLPWLKWLLEAGDAILIVDFGVEYGRHGRTGMAHMVPENRPFKVNSSFSGVLTDNFITRALAARRDNINKAIRRAIV